MNTRYKILILILLLFSSKASIAQHKHHASRTTPAAALWQKNIALLSKQHFGKKTATAVKTARTTDAIAERLVATSTYDYYWPDTMMGEILGLSDSTAYQYGGSRSSTFDYNQMFFDPTFYFGGEVIMGIGGSLGSRDPGNQPSILFDSMWTYSNGFSYYYYSTDTFGLTDVQYALYDSEYNVTDWADLGVPDSFNFYEENRYINSYDISNNLVSTYNLSWNMGYWDTAEYTTFSYNYENQVVQDSTFIYMGGGVWQLFEEWLYTFDDSGNMIHVDYYDDSEGTWQYTMQYFMHYNTLNQITWDSVIQFAGTWLPQASDTFGYTTGLDYITYQCDFTIDGGIPASYLFRTKHITGGQPDTLYQWEINYGDSTLIDGAKYSFTYDAHGEPIIENEYVLNLDTPYYTTGWYDSTIDYITYYYYQTYEERKANTNTTIPSKITIYPNPTTNDVRIYRPGINNGAYTFIKLINATGQTVRTESLPWLSETETVSLQSLVPGVYQLVIQDKNGNTIYRQGVVRE